MIPTLFLLGPSDNEVQNPSISKRVQGGVKVTTNLSGVLPILPYVMNDRTLRAKSHTVLLGVHEVQIPRNARVNLFNLVGDADSSSNMLHNVQAIANKIQPVRCFNQPSHVFRTSRERLPKTLANIQGCIVPRVETANPKTFDELQAVCHKFDSWPVILRAIGYHGGENMILLSEASELEAIKDLSWPYSGVFLIEFFDYINDNGLYHKARVIMVDGAPFPRHCIYSDQRLIHAGSRVDLMHQDLGLCHQEEHFLDTGLREYAHVFREIYKRIELDIFGIDFALVKGQIVIFEANACMKFLDRQYIDDSRYQYLDSRVKVLKRAIKKMLVQT
jgi:glutathione synthase/RimK-type ligase-like ATP-grasp enzyme